MTKHIESAYIKYKAICITPLEQQFPVFQDIEPYLRAAFEAGAIALFDSISKASVSPKDTLAMVHDIKAEIVGIILHSLELSMKQKESCPQSDQDFQSGAI